jgi:hypothetical protein
MLKMDQVHVLRHKVLKGGRSIRRVAREWVSVANQAGLLKVSISDTTLSATSGTRKPCSIASTL